MLDIATAARLCLNFLVVAVIDGVLTATTDNHRAVFAKEADKATAVAVTAESLPGDRLAIGELIADCLGIGCLLVVLEGVTTADGTDPCGIIHTESPAADIQRVDAVVTQFAITPMPEPVPVVVHTVTHVVGPWCWPLPEVVIQVGWHIGRGTGADRPSQAEIECARMIDLADHSVA